MACFGPLAAAAAIAALAVAPAASAKTIQKTETATLGQVQATFSYTKKGEFTWTNLHLAITRAGHTGFDAAIPAGCPDPDCGLAPGNLGRTPSIRILDLNRDGEPEVIVDLFTGGAHCCLVAEIYSYQPTGDSYRPTEMNFWDASYTLNDINGDGLPEFRTVDARSRYLFTAFAFSSFPIQIFHFDKGKLVDATRDFPQLVQKDAKYQFKVYQRQRKHRDGDVRGPLAAYVADQYLLGRGPTGMKLVKAALRRRELSRWRGDGFPSGRHYIKVLREFLVDAGYAPAFHEIA
jgi:hypothetical protein